MICTNELAGLKCNKRAILEPLTVIIAPFAPHIAEELYHLLGHEDSVCDASWPQYEEKYLVEDSFTYPVSFNGKMRFTLALPVDCTQEQALAAVLANPDSDKWLGGKTVKKIVFVPKRIINIVC